MLLKLFTKIPLKVKTINIPCIQASAVCSIFSTLLGSYLTFLLKNRSRLIKIQQIKPLRKREGYSPKPLRKRIFQNSSSVHRNEAFHDGLNGVQWRLHGGCHWWGDKELNVSVVITAWCCLKDREGWKWGGKEGRRKGRKERRKEERKKEKKEDRMKAKKKERRKEGRKEARKKQGRNGRRREAGKIEKNRKEINIERKERRKVGRKERGFTGILGWWLVDFEYFCQCLNALWK